MTTPTVSMEMATKLVENPPTLHPRPNGTNIQTLVQYFEGKLGSMPSHQLQEYGYSGMVAQTEVCALKCATPWSFFPDPGPHRTIDPLLDAAGQNDKKIEFKFKKGVYDTENIIKRAIIAGLNKAVPWEYRRITGGDRITRIPRNRKPA